MTFMFLIIILGATSPKAPAGFAPIAIGLALALIHLVSIPVTNTSVNPAPSTGQAIFAGWPYLIQLPFSWFVPILGAMGTGAVWKWLAEEEPARSATAAASAPRRAFGRCRSGRSTEPAVPRPLRPRPRRVRRRAGIGGLAVRATSRTASGPLRPRSATSRRSADRVEPPEVGEQHGDVRSRPWAGSIGRRTAARAGSGRRAGPPAARGRAPGAGPRSPRVAADGRARR